MTDHARVVIIGGGIMGVSVLYHLAENSWTDIVLCEKAELTSGSTWHAAGQMGLALSSRLAMWTVKYSIDLYQRLEQQTGQAISWHEPGSLRMAYDDDELDWLKVHLGIGKQFGVDMDIITADEIKNVHPFYNADGIKAALRTYRDGHVDPSGATQVMAKAARDLGARISRNNRVTGVEKSAGNEWRVHTQNGTIITEHVVIAAGSYANQVGKWFGLTVPSLSLLHHYFVTDTVPEFVERSEEIPVVRDHYYGGYIRQEQKSGLIGVYENADATPVWADGAPWDAVNELFEPDYDVIGHLLENAFDRMPVLSQLGIKRAVRGAITHTPDGGMLLGPAPGYHNVWMACGASIGIAWGGGSGKCLADMMTAGEAPISIRALDPRRFGDWVDHDYVVRKTTEEFESRHDTPVPGRQLPACRPWRNTPLLEQVKARGGVMGDIQGFERARWFADQPGAEDSNGWRRQSWHNQIATECAAVRHRAGVIDLTAFSLFGIKGPDAYAFLDRLSANRPPQNTSRIRLCHLLTEKGHFESEITITRLADDYYFVGSSVMGEPIRDRDWFNRHINPDEQVRITNLTDQWGTLALSGPASREILAHGTDSALDNQHFPWLTGQRIKVFNVDCIALRVSFTGELGWELHTDMANLPRLYQALHQAGQPLGLRDIGSHAFNSLRLEKMYRGSSELTPEVGLVDAGMMRFFKQRNRDFIGREASLERRQQPEGWQLAYLAVDANDADCHGGEPLLLGGEYVGMITSGAYGHSVGQSLAFGYVKGIDINEHSSLSVQILGETCAARVLTEPVWDPNNERPTA